jgi:NAD(P)-dependent dehydrogenase (short-subunit alcohol dehydrogenase family)
MGAEEKIAVVTGANRGLGRALTEALARQGATVLMVCRDGDAGREAEAGLRAEHLDARLFVADVEFTADVERLRAEVEAHYPRVDVLVNNAGVMFSDDDIDFEDMDLEVLIRTMNINFRGAVWMCRQFLRLLRNSESGRIINLTSGLGRLSHPTGALFPAYSMSKTAINGLTKLLAEELDGSGIIVVSADPGWVKTDLGGDDAPRDVEEGIDTQLWLATVDADQIESGRVYCDRTIVDW